MTLAKVAADPPQTKGSNCLASPAFFFGVDDDMAVACLLACLSLVFDGWSSLSFKLIVMGGGAKTTFVSKEMPMRVPEVEN